MSWKIASVLDKCNITFLVNQYRKKMGLLSVGNAWNHILGEDTIVACDKQVAKVPEDVQNALTRDYSGLMKAINKKKSGEGNFRP